MNSRRPRPLPRLARAARGLRAGAILTLLALAGAAAAEPVDDGVHMGVATCASGVCHGKLSPQEGRNVWLNEYRMWSADDRHARSYQTLLSADSQRIARKLGLPNAQGAAICLDCHTDNVAPSRRGPKFQLSDGVGCEACHGGAGKWIESHTEPATTRADNVASGMLATERIDVRAEICLSCHLGTRNQFATHRIMGAGHPRLSFELQAYTVNQPAHYAIDDDYRSRKGAPNSFDVWRAGQVESLRRYLTLMESPLFASSLPDFSFFDCHSCHHPMDDIRWSETRRQQGLEPGGLRLQDQHLVVLRALVEVLTPADLQPLRDAHVRLLKAGQESVPAARAAATALKAWLATRTWVSAPASRDQVKAVRKAIAQAGGRGELGDFAAAEQAFLSIESLSIYLGDEKRLQAALDGVFDAVETDRGFDPKKLRSAMERLVRDL